MKTKFRKLQLLLALPVVAVLALPGEAKTFISQDFAALAPAAESVPTQAVFGLLLDPHANPVLTIELPAAYSVF